MQLTWPEAATEHELQFALIWIPLPFVFLKWEGHTTQPSMAQWLHARVGQTVNLFDVTERSQKLKETTLLVCGNFQLVYEN